MFKDLEEFRAAVAQIPRQKIRAWLWEHAQSRQPLRDLVHEVQARLALIDFAAASRIEWLEAYVRTVCRNVAVDWIRNRRKLRETHSEVDVDAIPHTTRTPEKAAAVQQELEKLQKVIDGLPHDQRKIFWLRKIFGYSDREIASIMRMSEKDVQNTLRCAVRRIDAVMNEGRGEEDVNPDDCRLGFEEDL